MSGIRYLTADREEAREGKRCFSLETLAGLYPNARADLRSKARGVVVLTSLLHQLQEEGFHPGTGVFLFCGPGPSSPRTGEALLQSAPEERAAIVERTLPPKDYFISNPAMKAAQVSIEFQLHGPWMAFLSPQHGFAQACRLAQDELVDGALPAVLIGGIFALDDPAESRHWPVPSQGELVEAVVVQYARTPQEVFVGETLIGKYGPLTRWLEEVGGV